MLSIILPCYNVAQYIERAMESLLAQARLDCEIIIVDDGSTDNLLEVCSRWKELENVKIVHTENRGVSEARNEGLRLAKGEFVYFMDPDDWIEKDVLCEMMDLFEDGVDAVRGKVCSEDFPRWNRDIPTDVEVVKTAELLPKYIGYSLEDLDEFVHESLNERKELSYVWTFIFRRSVLVDNAILFAKGLHFMEDKLFLCEFFCYARNVALCSNAFYHYCVREDGLVATNFADNIKHAKQRLLAERCRETLTKKVKRDKGIDIEPLYQGTLILAAIELLLNCRKGRVRKQYGYYREFRRLESVRRAFDNYNPLRLLLCFPHRLLRMVKMLSKRVR